MLTGKRVIFPGMVSDGCFSFDSCLGSPIIMNSDFDGFKERRFADIQFATAEIVFCNDSILLLKDEGEKEMNSWVSSAYR